MIEPRRLWIASRLVAAGLFFIFGLGALAGAAGLF